MGLVNYCHQLKQRTGRMTSPESTESLANRGARLLGLDTVIIIIVIINNSSACISKSLSILSLIHVLKVRAEVQYRRQS